MKKFFIFIFMISFLHGNNFEIKEIISKKQIFDKSLKIELITTKKNIEEGLSPETFLKIDSFNKEYIVKIKDKMIGLVSIHDIDILSKDKILIYLSYTTKIESWYLDLSTKQFTFIGNGIAEVINKNEFLVKNAKGYIYIDGESHGAYWVNKIVDKDGDLIKLISEQENNGTCHKISNLIRKNINIIKFEQSFDDCIYVKQ